MIHIPIVMATDNNYMPLEVALISLIENAAKNTFYDIYILIDSSVVQESVCVINEALKKYTGKCSVNFKNVGNIFKDVLINIPHTTVPTYFRLAIPDLLDEKKCIYLDTDTIIMTDLQELFATSLENCYVAGVWHPGVKLFEWEETICKNANIPDAEQYVNAGVLVMNLEEMRKADMVKIFLKLISMNMPSQDQDIINHACYGKIKFIPFKYNVMPKLADKCIEDYKQCYSVVELREAWNSPCIIHYADRSKPWNSGDCVFMDFWWKYCRKTPLYKYIVTDFLEEFVTSVIYSSCAGKMFAKQLPNLFELTYQRKYIIYGAGKRAREIIIFMRRMKIVPEFVVVSEMAKNPTELEGIVVKDITEAGKMLYDKSIIIAVRENLHKEIIKKVQNYDYIELFPVLDSFSCI